VEDAKAKGGKVLTGGKRASMKGELAHGHFYEPTVIGEATTDMRIYQEETFGPAIPCFRFNQDIEAVDMANDTEYGLAAYFYTKVPTFRRQNINPDRHKNLACTTLNRVLHRSNYRSICEIPRINVQICVRAIRRETGGGE
jgi:acyl-CoA reductase-like NAD-dependent aldehyde dehydrogenase